MWDRGDGRPIDPRADWQAWTDLLNAAGVRHVRLHDARHVAATVLLSMGVHQLVTADILGHATVAMVARYSHTDLGMMRAALGLVNGVYSPAQLEAQMLP